MFNCVEKTALDPARHNHRRDAFLLSGFRDTALMCWRCVLSAGRVVFHFIWSSKFFGLCRLAQNPQQSTAQSWALQDRMPKECERHRAGVAVSAQAGVYPRLIQLLWSPHVRISVPFLDDEREKQQESCLHDVRCETGRPWHAVIPSDVLKTKMCSFFPR